MAPDGSPIALQLSMYEQARAANSLRSVGDLADATPLLVSEKSRWITAQFISVSDGIDGTMQSGGNLVNRCSYLVNIPYIACPSQVSQVSFMRAVILSLPTPRPIHLINIQLQCGTTKTTAAFMSTVPITFPLVSILHHQLLS